MLRIALNPGRAAILNRDQDPASIGAIVRARGMDDLFHHPSIIRLSKYAGRYSRQSRNADQTKENGRPRGRPFNVYLSRSYCVGGGVDHYGGRHHRSLVKRVHEQQTAGHQRDRSAGLQARSSPWC